MASSTRDLKRRRRQRKATVLEQLIAGCAAEKVAVHFVDGRSLEGALLYNPIKHSGKLINVDQEFSLDFHTNDVRLIKVLIGRDDPQDFTVFRGVQDMTNMLASHSHLHAETEAEERHF